MAFDNTNQADLDALHTEVFTDPAGMGYNPTGGTNALLNLLNDPAKNVGGETAGQRLTVDMLFDAVGSAPDAFSVGSQFSDGLQTFIGKLLNKAGSTDIERFRDEIQNGMQQNNPIRQFLEAQTRAISRAEVLFGTETEITRNDWIAARDNGSVV